MQHESKPRRHRKRKGSLPSFLLLAGLTLMGLITLSLFTGDRVKASEVRPTQIASANYWQAGSFPVENFLAYTSPFGYRQSATGGYGSEFHSGLDMAAPEGSYIRNWWTGQVVEVSDNTRCGTSIKIQSGNWKHVYCHMKGHVETSANGRYLIDREGGIQIWQGQQLPTGARIGRVGMTGRTTGPHLHWAVKYANEYIDPARILRAMYAQQPGSPSASSYLRRRG
ncbi:MAG: M23 family metallopeptidase [Cyanobacteriota bacterium]|nr:M23 family metallopeptidase [Cyanobacteriota bacterium]